MGSGIAVTAGRTGRSLAISIYDSTNREYARPICLTGRIPDQSTPNRTQNKKIEHKATIITKERDKNGQKQDSDGNIECCGDHSGNYHSIHRKHIDYLRVWDHPKFSDHSSTAQLAVNPYAVCINSIKYRIGLSWRNGVLQNMQPNKRRISPWDVGIWINLFCIICA